MWTGEYSANVIKKFVGTERINELGSSGLCRESFERG